uniref:ethanolamine-phosphate cytidylyltransferase n=1 Tax=Eucampia antarctica TaxID=49252 RepID=A0A7S2R0F4_9STRA
MGSNGISAAMNSTTEGWLELFLTPAEKRHFSQWEEQVLDKSLSNRVIGKHLLDGLCHKYMPDNVAPNVVTASGFLSLSQAWYVINKYGTEFPTACTWFAVLNIVYFYLSHSCDVKHASRIRQRTALGDLFKYCCDCISTVFLVTLTTYCLGGTQVTTQWYAVQASQLVLFVKHLSAFHRHAGLRYNVLTGPGEVILSVIVLLSIRAIFGLDWLIRLYQVSVHKLVWNLDKVHVLNDNHLEKFYDPVALGSEAMMMLYYAMYVTAVVKTMLLKKPHGWSRFGLSASLLMRFLPAIFLHFGVPSFELKTADVICDGIFMAVLTSDVTLAKMAGREIHPWVVLMSMCSVLSHSIIITLVIIYYIAVFADLCSYLNMPLMTVCRNVYCDGIYDLCHIGHKRAFKNALTYGNRLFVGVVGDEDSKSYKRPPIMTHDERCAEVEACKSVTKVITNAPCFGLTPQFLDKHQIHIVAMGEEYMDRYPDPKDDPYYSYPRSIGIARTIPRTEGLSTSDLLRRIQNARPAEKRNDT